MSQDILLSQEIGLIKKESGQDKIVPLFPGSNPLIYKNYPEVLITAEALCRQSINWSARAENPKASASLLWLCTRA
jgi:hypothetical protein